MTQLSELPEATEPTITTPRRRRGQAMSQAEMDRRYPSLSILAQGDRRAAATAWVAVFHAHPDAMHRLIADYIKQAAARPGRIGQRPMPREDQVNFDSLLHGEFSEEPLSVVLPKLMGKESERNFAPRAHMSRSQLGRIMRGEVDPDLAQLQALANAVGKPPTYFLEYRTMMVMAAMMNLMEGRPGIATRLYRTYLSVRLGEAS